jgi:alkanesulfonate monooxygenase SsuD/methylene tetrahydromethanopterin reductase-like flavin-dependent oxidoreductase (luciferase family)
VARQFASLDHLSGGRAAWNVVTSWDAFTGENFRRGGFLPQEDRYERARTFLQTTWELFDSWPGHEILADKESGVFLVDATAGRFAHTDQFFDIAGRFNVPRSPQGRPVIFQAGDSEQGREFAASSADAISNGLRFAANYHVSPATVIEAVEGYRAAFRPSADLDRPYVSVSADVVVAGDEATARGLASGYGLWVRSIRSGEGAIPFPAPAEARLHAWTGADRALVADRVDTQFVGSSGQVADQLEQLQEATGADELIVTTITHDHADRVRSYQLLAEEWRRRHRLVLTTG